MRDLARQMTAPRVLWRIAWLLCAALCLSVVGCGERNLSRTPSLQEQRRGVELATKLGLKPDGGKTAAIAPILQPVKLLHKSYGLVNPLLSPDKRHLRIGRLMVSIPSGAVTKTADAREIPSPDGKKKAVYTTSKSFIDGMCGTGRIYASDLKVVRNSDGATVPIGTGGVFAWSPDGQQIAWTPSPAPPQLVVSNAETGRELSRRSVPLEFYGQVRRARPLVNPDPSRPETWQGVRSEPGPGYGPWPSPDANRVVYFTEPGFPDNHIALGFYGKSGMKEICPLPEGGLGGRGTGTTEVVWYPDSREFLYLTGPAASMVSPGSQSLYIVTAEGHVTPVQLKHSGAKYDMFSFFQMLDADQQLVLYCVNSGTPMQQELWIGQLQGVK